MKKLLSFLVLFLTIVTYGQSDRPEIHCKHFFYGYPFGAPKTNDLIIRDIYALSNNDDTKFADWVAYRLSMHEVDGDLTVTRKWAVDPWLDPSETLEKSDYTGANDELETDRGHQAPLASFKGSRHASHTNFLSNITPQKANMNQGVWKHMEAKVRDMVEDLGEVFVMTGPVYAQDMRPLPEADEPHKVPSGYWKIVCSEKKGKINVAAFFFDQETPKNDKILDHLTTVANLEQKTDLDFFWLLDEMDELKLESEENLAFASKYFTQ